jgi:hypothetical protein
VKTEVRESVEMGGICGKWIRSCRDSGKVDETRKRPSTPTKYDSTKGQNPEVG